MNAIKEARKIIMATPDSSEARTLARLVLAVESEGSFQLGELYELDSLDTFDLALKILTEWRLDRYYAGKGKLIDVSYQVNAMDPR